MSLAPQNWVGGAHIITAYCTFHGKVAKSLEMLWRTQVKSAAQGLLMSWLYHESQAMTVTEQPKATQGGPKAAFSSYAAFLVKRGC